METADSKHRLDRLFLINRALEEIGRRAPGSSWHATIFLGAHFEAHGKSLTGDALFLGPWASFHGALHALYYLPSHSHLIQSPNREKQRIVGIDPLHHP